MNKYFYYYPTLYNSNSYTFNYNNNINNKNYLNWLILRAELYILYNYPHLISVNYKLLNKDIDNIVKEGSSIYFIKSLTEEDIHKAIKYNIWSSTKFGNKILNNEYNNIKNKNTNNDIASDENNSCVYLLFTSYTSNQIVGIARMISEVYFENIFSLWTKDNWKGTFNIEWLLIRDVPFNEFGDLLRYSTSKYKAYFKSFQNKFFYEYQDFKKLPFKQGKEIIKRMIEYQCKTSILEYFEYYDTRQANYEHVVNTKLDSKNNLMLFEKSNQSNLQYKSMYQFNKSINNNNNNNLINCNNFEHFIKKNNDYDFKKDNNNNNCNENNNSIIISN